MLLLKWYEWHFSLNMSIDEWLTAKTAQISALILFLPLTFLIVVTAEDLFMVINKWEQKVFIVTILSNSFNSIQILWQIPPSNISSKIIFSALSAKNSIKFFKLVKVENHMTCKTSVSQLLELLSLRLWKIYLDLPYTRSYTCCSFT